MIKEIFKIMMGISVSYSRISCGAHAYIRFNNIYYMVLELIFSCFNVVCMQLLTKLPIFCPTLPAYMDSEKSFVLLFLYPKLPTSSLSHWIGLLTRSRIQVILEQLTSSADRYKVRFKQRRS